MEWCPEIQVSLTIKLSQQLYNVIFAQDFRVITLSVFLLFAWQFDY